MAFMKKSYKINKFKLKKILKKLKDEGNHVNLCDISTLEDLTNFLFNISPAIKRKNYLNELKKEALEYKTGSIIRPHVESFLSQGMIIPEVVDPRYTDIHFSDDKTIEIVKDFYSHLDKFFYAELENYLKNGNSHIEFFNPRPGWDGTSFLLHNLNDAYVTIPNHRTISKLSIAVHEIQHVLDFFNNKNFSYQFIIREVSSIFMELISLDYIGEKYDLEEDSYIRRFYLHSIIKTDGFCFLAKDELLNAIKEHSQLSSGDLVKFLRDEFEYTKRELYNFSLNDIKSLSLYQISYLIAIELYYIYQQDKKVALNILKDIILKANDQNFMHILNNNGITLNKSVVQYEDDLCRKLELI